jgi:hypothetical protein
MSIGGVEITLSGIVDLIILLGALCGAIYKIWETFAKPTSTLKKRKEERDKAKIVAVLNEVLPSKLYDHDLEVRDRYKADRANYLKLIRDDVLTQVSAPL